MDEEINLLLVEVAVGADVVLDLKTLHVVNLGPTQLVGVLDRTLAHFLI
jgi:hypothetical protein